MENTMDNIHLFMILNVCSVMYIYAITQHRKCHGYHAFVHNFKYTFSNSVYNQTFRSRSMNRSTCGNNHLKLKLVHFDNIM